MQYIDFKVLSGEENMQLDNQLLQECKKPTLRLYGWSEPTLTVGKHQKLSTRIQNYCEENCIPIIRRPTGGRALLHNQELTYAFVCPKSFLKNGDNVLESYKEISQAIVEGLKEINLNLEFARYSKVSVKSGYCMGLSTGSDLTYQGKKIVGSAQCRTKSSILQHGSILIDYDKQLLEELFDEPLNNLTSLKQIDPTLCDIDLLCSCIKNGFEKNFMR